MKNLYFFSTVLLFVTISFHATAQNSTWSVYKDLDQVKIEQKVATCTPQGSADSFEYTFLKLTNKTAQELFVTFKIESYFNGTCTTCPNDEYLFTFHISANGSVEPDCSMSGQNGRLAVFMKNVNKPNYSTFNKFELSNIIVQVNP